MFVKFNGPYFKNGVLEYEAGKAVNVPDEIALPEIAKGFAVQTSAPTEEANGDGKKEKKAGKGK